MTLCRTPRRRNLTEIGNHFRDAHQLPDSHTRRKEELEG
jgi:hypothetical protein